MNHFAMQVKKLYDLPSDNFFPDPVCEIFKNTQTSCDSKDSIIKQNQVKVSKPFDFTEFAEQIKVGDA